MDIIITWALAYAMLLFKLEISVDLFLFLARRTYCHLFWDHQCELKAKISLMSVR